jgi:hypothetical protein
MREVIRIRKEILRNIERLGEQTSEFFHTLELKIIYDFLREKMKEVPSLEELEVILDDLVKAENGLRKDKDGYYWRDVR